MNTNGNFSSRRVFPWITFLLGLSIGVTSGVAAARSFEAPDDPVPRFGRVKIDLGADGEVDFESVIPVGDELETAEDSFDEAAL